MPDASSSLQSARPHATPTQHTKLVSPGASAMLCAPLDISIPPRTHNQHRIQTTRPSVASPLRNLPDRQCAPAPFSAWHAAPSLCGATAAALHRPSPCSAPTPQSPFPQPASPPAPASTCVMNHGSTRHKDLLLQCQPSLRRGCAPPPSALAPSCCSPAYTSAVGVMKSGVEPLLSPAPLSWLPSTLCGVNTLYAGLAAPAAAASARCRSWRRPRRPPRPPC